MKRRIQPRSGRPVRRRRWRAGAAVLLGIAALSMSMTSCTPPSALTVTDVVTNINQPWDIAFTPDGTMLFTRKAGNINAFIGGTVRTFTGAGTDIRSISEGGMMGLAVDPNFATNRRIYACFLSALGTFATTSGNLDVRIARWTLDAGYTTLSNRTDIVTHLPVNMNGQTGRHSGCRPRFGPDGNLWVGTGDAATGTNPQNKQSLGGKVLRVDTDGNGVAGNPGVDNPASGFLPQIYNYGHRNVQGIAFRYDGTAYSVEHGTNCDDEVNLLEAGANYGWDPLPGTYNEATPMTDLTKFPDAKVATWSSGCPTIAPSGATFVTGAQWAGWQNNLIIAVLKDHHLRTEILNGDGHDTFTEYTSVSDQGRLRSAVQGPDGNLYVATDQSPGKIIKVTPTP